MTKTRKIEVDGRAITVVNNDTQDYISLTDIAKYKTDDSSAVIGNWMRNRKRDPSSLICPPRQESQNIQTIYSFTLDSL